MCQCLGSGQSNISRHNIGHAVFTVICRLFLCQHHLDASQLVYDLYQIFKINDHIVLHIQTELLIDRVDRQTHAAVSKGVAQLALSVTVDLHQ